MKTSEWIKSKKSLAVQTISQLRMSSANKTTTSYDHWLSLAREVFRLAKFPLPANEQLYAHYLNGRSPLNTLNIEQEDSRVS